MGLTHQEAVDALRSAPSLVQLVVATKVSLCLLLLRLVGRTSESKYPLLTNHLFPLLHFRLVERTSESKYLLLTNHLFPLLLFRLVD